ncbi:hypothetical protein Verru16b_02023 [Lacunisphaera limnophila]|uniref:Uncharacterized protein n=1 Tax=Lacunisphaera limnophila TaxID=1838286 RepID=A0A1D8AVM2_9BACT|nr:hypothetical protein [Lacunisphaera limnophila]AOS44954.1 hypothetical protein Verru16b_02023 [Lacunisphaera limnophila]
MSPAAVNRGWFWAAVTLTAVKLWLTGGQTVYAIGPAIHDDKLFVGLAGHLLDGNWLGPYNQFTLAKGPMFPLFLALVFWTGLPLLLAQHLLYAGACAAATRALTPWLRSGSIAFLLYSVLLLNPMSYDAGNLSRLMRQNIYAPLALLVFAGLVTLFARRRESWRRQALPAASAGLALGLFWLTREESVWLLPAVGLVLFGIATSLGREAITRWRPLAASLSLLLITALLPVLVVCSLNHRYYGWFGTVEFRAPEFNAAYGALTRLQTGPRIEHVTVTRQMRETAYTLSPAFDRVRPFLEGAAGAHWFDASVAPISERQIRGGWFMWAMRDAVIQAGLASDAGEALRYYQQVADELNAACDAGRVPALPPRRGFLPPLGHDSIGPLLAGAREYCAYFVLFKGFTARSLDSEGDYAELKPFRDLVGTRLSHAPRSPDPFPPTQSDLEHRKVEWLDLIGKQTGLVLGWLGPLLLLVGFTRLVESALERRITFLLGFATALLVSCLAYFTINVLVHVTSFYNMTPAAMAAAYPLYLLALAVMAVEAFQAWNRPATAASSSSAAPSRWRWLVPAGVALAVFAARLREIHLFGSDVPYNDQWIIEAQQLIGPWLAGTLRPWAFFVPHFEHLPVWTRLLAWLQVALTGRWDPLVQMTVNAALHGTFLWLAARWVWQSLAPRAAGYATIVLLAGGALPFAWENIAWGFQSQFPFALVFLLLHVLGSFTHAPGSRGWWLAQAAGLAGLFTLASMWLAPLAVVAAYFWTGPRDRRAWAAPAAVALLGLGLLALIHACAPAGHSFAQVARSPLDLLRALLHLLGWPSILPGAAVLVPLPWLIHALRLRGRPDTSNLDRIIFALGLWGWAHAGALAFARVGDINEHVSRYGDVLFIGVLAGALALTRLLPAPGPRRALFLGAALAWTGLVGAGLFHNATEAHARYFHQTAAPTAELRRHAVQAYLQRGDRQLLEQPETRWVLTQNTDVVTALLDQPAFRELLPTSVNPAAPDYALGTFFRWLLAHWPGLLVLGLAVLLAGLGVLAWRGSTARPPPAPAPLTDRWPGRVALVLGLACTAGLFAWHNPLAFDRAARWDQLLGGNSAVRGLTFEFVTESPYGPERLQGAAPLDPIEVRNRYFGTAPAGSEFTGTVLSSPFPLTKPWLIVPIAGYPNSEGNGLRLRLLDTQGVWHDEEIGCPGPNQDTIAYWPVDVSAYVGLPARLVLYDGRSGPEGWVAVAPPIPSDTPDLADTLGQRLQQETRGRLHASLGIIALVAYLLAFGSWWCRRHPVGPA